MTWTVEQRAGVLWRVVNGTRVWGANKEPEGSDPCTEAEARVICDALNVLDGRPTLQQIYHLIHPGAKQT